MAGQTVTGSSGASETSGAAGLSLNQEEGQHFQTKKETNHENLYKSNPKVEVTVCYVTLEVLPFYLP